MRDGGGRGRILGICNHCLACRVEREKPCRIVRVRKAHNQGHFSLSSSPSSSSLPSSRSQSRQPCSACGSNLRQKGGIYVKSQTITCRMREGGMHAGASCAHENTRGEHRALTYAVATANYRARHEATTAFACARQQARGYRRRRNAAIARVQSATGTHLARAANLRRVSGSLQAR